MSTQNPYERLGINEDASFEEIQAAKTSLSQENKENVQVLESIEAAYDAIIMDRLKRRQEGKIKVPERIRFPERVETPPQSSPLPQVQPPNWLEQYLDTPSSRELLWTTGIFGILSVISFVNPGSLSLLIALGIFANIYLINRKEQRTGRSVLITLGSLIVGLGIGAILNSLLGQPSDWSLPQLSTFATFIVFWVSSSFMR